MGDLSRFVEFPLILAHFFSSVYPFFHFLIFFIRKAESFHGLVEFEILIRSFLFRKSSLFDEILA